MNLPAWFDGLREHPRYPELKSNYEAWAAD